MYFRHVLLTILAVVTLGTGCAHARDRPFDPGASRTALALPPTEVMVFGVTHLDGLPANFDLAWMAPIMCRLRAFAPDVILTEAMSGEQVLALDAFAAVHGDVAAHYGGPTLAMAKEAQAALGVTGAQALAEARTLTATHDIAPAQRRRLAAVLIAAGDPFSALVQWWQLPAVDRHAGDGLTDALARRLDKFAAARGEISSVAARLAADLGHARVIGVGDHTSDVALPDDEAFRKAVTAEPELIRQFNHATAELAPIGKDAMRLDRRERVLPVFQLLNSRLFGRLDAGGQWVSLLRSTAVGPLGRQRVAAWEAQNIKMFASIREATAPIPGGRALLIVGAAHKPYLDAYLQMLGDVRVVSVPVMLDAHPAGCVE